MSLSVKEVNHYDRRLIKAALDYVSVSRRLTEGMLPDRREQITNRINAQIETLIEKDDFCRSIACGNHFHALDDKTAFVTDPGWWEEHAHEVRRWIKLNEYGNHDDGFYKIGFLEPENLTLFLLRWN